MTHKGRIENVLNTAFMTYSCLKKTVNVINDVYKDTYKTYYHKKCECCYK